MKNKQLIPLLLTFVFLFGAGFLNDASAQKAKKETVTLSVEKMTCKNCQAKIEKNIAFEKGVTDLKFDLKKKEVKVTFRTDKTNLETILKAFNKLGFPAKKVEERENKDKNKLNICLIE